MGDAPCNQAYEAVMKEIGEFGRFQKWLCVFLTLSSVPNGYFAMSMVFIGRTPKFVCFRQALDNNTVGSLHKDPGVCGTGNRNQRDAINDTEELLHQTKEINNSHSSQSTNHTLTGCPNGYVYLFDDGRTSIVSEWDLVCDRKWIVPLIMSIYMGGVLVGSLVSGTLSDKFGRYPLLMTGTAFMFVFLGLCGVSTSPIMFSIFFFLAGLFGFVNYVAGFILSSEMTDTEHRALTGTLAIGGFAVGYMLLPLFAYFIVDWRILCFALASTGIVFIPYFWLITESPRWLYTKNNRSKFSKLFLKIAVTNGVKLETAERILQRFYENTVNEAKVIPSQAKLLSEENIGKNGTKASAKKQYSYLDLLRIRKVLPRTLCMWLIWFTCSVIYYGVAFNTSNMGGNPFINCFIAAAVEIPAYVIVVILLKWHGRKSILITALLVSGLTCAAVPYIDTKSTKLSIAFAMTGKLAVSAAFSVVFLLCSELFPTLMRSMGVGSSSMTARVGGMIAPYLLYLGSSNRFIPYILMGLLGLGSAAACLILPESKSNVMPETINDLQPVTCIKFKALIPEKMRSPNEVPLQRRGTQSV